MTDELLKKLLYRASVYGLKGYIVGGYIPPSTATEDPEGQLIIEKYIHDSASEDDLRW